MTRLMVAGLGLGLALTVALDGCAPTEPMPVPAAISSPSPTEETPSEETATFPSPAVDLTCADLIDPASVAALYGTTISTRLPRTLNLYDLPLIALEQDGGLRCEWALPDADEYTPAVLITALVDAAAGFAMSRATLEADPYNYASLDDADGSFLSSCHDWRAENTAQCHWSALSGDLWIEVSFEGLPLTEVTVPSPRQAPDTSWLPLQPILSGSTSASIVRSALATLNQAKRVVQPSPAAARSCEEVAPSSAPEIAELGIPVMPVGGAVAGGNFIGHTQGQWITSRERQGWTTCRIEVGLVWLILTSAPGAGWIVEAEMGPMPSFERCGIEEQGEWCQLAAVVDGTLFVVDQHYSADPATPRAVLAAMVAAQP